MPPWSGTRSWRNPARWSCAGWTTTASWSACRARTSADFWYALACLQPGRRAAGGGLQPGWRAANCCGSGTWDGGSCSAACRAGDTSRSTPDGRRLLFSAPEGGIGIWDRLERRVVRRLPLEFMHKHLALDPEGRRLAVNNADEAAPRVVIIELETGRVLDDWRSQVGIGAMAWSADGQLLAVGGGGDDGRVYVWNVRRGALSSMLQGHIAHIGCRVRALGLPAGDRERRRHDAALGRGLGGAPGDRAGWVRGLFRRTTAGWPSLQVGRSASGT